MSKRLFLIILLLPLLSGLAACGSDSDDESSSSETTEATSGDEAECTTDGATDAGADSSIDAALGEWYVTIEPTEVPAGVVSIVADNQSESSQVHELVVVEADGIDSLEVDGTTVSEEALGDTVVGEIAEFAAGQTCDANFELAAGSYVLFCNLPDHFAQGMAAELTVAG